MSSKRETPAAPESARTAALFVVGWGTLWAWLGTINGSYQVTKLLDSLDMAALLSCIVMSALALWRIILALFSGKLNHLLGSTRCIGAASIEVAICTIIVLIGLQQAIVPVLFLLVFGCALCALGVAWLSAAWVRALARLPESDIFLFVVGGFLLASFINLSISWLPDFATTLCAALFPLVSGSCLVLAMRAGASSDPSSPHSANQAPAPSRVASASPFVSRPYVACVVLSIFCYGLAGAIVRILSRTTSAADDVAMLSAASSHTLGIALCAATLLAIALMRHGSERNLLPSLSKVMLAVMAFGMLLPGIFPAAPFFLADFVTGVSIGCFEIMLLTYAAIITKQRFVSPLITLGVTYGAMEAAAAIGYPLTDFLEHALTGGFAAQWSTVALVALFVFIVVSVGILIPFADRLGVPPAAAPADASVATGPSPFEALLRDRGLTDRETEVALLLAEGRNIPYIQERLVISQGTAQTHAYHIYQKLGIHSKQELIELAQNSLWEQV